MTAAELREKIRALALQVVDEKGKAEDAAEAYDELTKFPELKDIIVSLLTHEFDSFLEGIDWVAPRPTTFRINLRNDENFYLIWMQRSWIAQVEGKKYYLLNLPEEENCVQHIARVLRYGAPGDGAEAGENEEVDVDVEDNVDVEVDDTTDVEV